MNAVAGSPFHAFSQALADLFRAAETSSLDEFPAALLSILQPHLAFDGAVVGHADPLCYGDFSISVAHVHGRDASLLDEYRLVSAGDPVTTAFLKGLAHPLAVDTESCYEAPEHAAMLSYVRKHRLRHLLLCGHAPTTHQSGSWIVLYRSFDQGFDKMTADWFGAFCTHLDRALDRNRGQALAGFAPRHSRRGLALVDEQGRIEWADEKFFPLLKTEFQNALPHRLPQRALVSIKQVQPYEGRLIRMQFSPAGSRILCEVRAAGPLSLLTRRECQVARNFAEGQTSREIATNLGISQSTVHSHLASVYQKLGVSDKVSLSLIVAEDAGIGPPRKTSVAASKSDSRPNA